MEKEFEETNDLEMKENYECQKCGSVLNDEQEFCPKCGTKKGTKIIKNVLNAEQY